MIRTDKGGQKGESDGDYPLDEDKGRGGGDTWEAMRLTATAREPLAS